MHIHISNGKRGHIPWPVLGSILVLILLLSCVKEEFNADSFDSSLRFSPGIAVPIGYARYQIDELLDSANSTQLSPEEDGFMSLVYLERLESGIASELIKVQDISFTTSFENDLGIPINLSSIPGSLSFTDTLLIPVTIGIAGDARIDSVIVKSMDITIASSTLIDVNGMVSAESSDITDNQGNIFSRSSNFNSPDNVYQLADYTLRLTDTPSDRSLLEVIYTVTLYPSTGIIQPGDPVLNLTVGLSAVEYSVIYGYLGQFDLDLPVLTIPMNLYNPIYEGSFHFEGAVLSLIFRNSFGIPVEMTLNEFLVIGQSGQITAITGGNLPAPGIPAILGYPRIGEEGQTKVDSFILTADNSNLITALETAPSELRLDADGLVNPSDTAYNFVVEDSQYEVLLELFLPMYGYANNLVVSDTLDFVFSDFYDKPPEEIERLIFRLNFINGFPLNMKVQAYFYDENDVLLDSLFQDPADPSSLIAAATDTDNDGKVEPVELEPVEVDLTRQQIDNISSSSYMIVYCSLTTPGADQNPPENIRFYTDYFFEVFIGAIAQLDVNSTDYQ